MPSKAALRAAEAIEDRHYDLASRERVALAIDWEFAELVACLREAREELADMGRRSQISCWDASVVEGEIASIHARIDAALARVDGNSGE